MSHIVVEPRIESTRSIVYSIVDFDKLLFSILSELQRSVHRGIVKVHEALDLPSTSSSTFGNPFPTIACPRLALAWTSAHANGGLGHRHTTRANGGRGMHHIQGWVFGIGEGCRAVGRAATSQIKTRNGSTNGCTYQSPMLAGDTTLFAKHPHCRGCSLGFHPNGKWTSSSSQLKSA